MAPDSEYRSESKFTEELCDTLEILLVLVPLLDIGLQLIDCSLLQGLANVLLIVSIEMKDQKFPKSYSQSQDGKH